jgi:transposase
MWVPPENRDPIQLLAPTRQSISLFGAVNLRDGKMFHHFSLQFNALSFERFLVALYLRRLKGKRQMVILDNAKYHHARLLEPFLAKHKRTLSLLFLPPYSPELNPIERVWKITKRLSVHNQYFPDLDDLLLAVKNQLQAWVAPNESLRRLCGII